MKEEIQNLEDALDYVIRSKWKLIVSVAKNIANKTSSVRRTRQTRLMTVSNCALRDKKKSRLN